MAHPVVHRAKHLVRNYFLHIICGSLVLMSGMLLVHSDMKAAGSILFLDSFGYSNGILTNEYAHWNPGDGTAKTNANWDMTSGSLFASSGYGWSGTPDDISPNATSSNGTNSAVFRLNTKRYDFGDVYVSFRLKLDNLTTSGATPAVDWDGIHIFLRYQSEYNLYYASVNRRDGHVVIKKKCVGGGSNGGTYYSLGPGEVTGHPIPLGTWQNVGASVANNTDGSVTIKLYREGQLLVTATDTGTGCTPIRTAGATGIRGDNANFLFDDFKVESLAGTVAATPTPTPTPTPVPLPVTAKGNSANSNGSKATTPTPTPSPTITPSTVASASVTATPGPDSASGSETGQPSLLDPAVLTKAARTEPTFLAGAVAALLSIILAALLIHDHLHVRRRKNLRRFR